MSLPERFKPERRRLLERKLASSVLYLLEGHVSELQGLVGHRVAVVEWLQRETQTTAARAYQLWQGKVKG